MTGMYKLVEDLEWQEWRLLKAGGFFAESAFSKLDEAIERLADATMENGAIVEVIGGDESFRGIHICRTDIDYQPQLHLA